MNTVQAQQFAALQKATASYNNDAKMADHMRRREADVMSRAAEQNRRDEEELRIAHGELGEETRKQKDHEIEKKRYKHAVETDRQSIVKITSELKGIEADEREQKTQFVKEMESLNNENDFILTHRENKKMSQLLDAETVNWFVEIKLNATMKHGIDGVDEMQMVDESERWSEDATRAKDELAGLIEIEGRSSELTKKMNELEKFLQQLRAKFLLEHSNLGQIETNDLEAKWMNAFEEDGGEDTTDNEGGKAANGLTGGPSTIHMDLFYSDHE
ncbi:hypothetical protein ACHAW5_010460 [Stephanodiscus triporus]|uniref:Uncharacterized protein n=1 Tax=Stephanodiscus triporus TaxID=2934178 RepID=A0ABD3P9U2_9STRA